MPKTSFWGAFTKEGRLKSQWAHGLEEKDAVQSLKILRQVLQSFKENPGEFANLLLSFLDDFLDAGKVGFLSEADFATIDELGSAVSKLGNASIRPEDVWFRLIRAYDVRREVFPAQDLLTRIYNSPFVSKEIKADCARDLAKRGAKNAGQINIYFDHMHTVPQPSKETAVLGLLGSFLNVNFDTDKYLLEQNGLIALRIEECQVKLPGLQTTLGVYAFAIEHSVSKALPYFRKALEEDPLDRAALIGLYSCLIQREEFGKTLQIVPPQKYAFDREVIGLLKLGAVLQWLNDPTSTGLVPCSAQQLINFDVGRFAGDLLDRAVGIMYLLEGNAPQAFGVLVPLAGKHPDSSPQLNYYTAWAAMLLGRDDEVANRFTQTNQWAGAWVIGCLLLDTDVSLAESCGVQSCFSGVKGNFSSILNARLAITRGISPEKIVWSYDPKAIAIENLEAFRTFLGYLFYNSDNKALENALTEPIFQRLPLADQLLWRGLYAIMINDLEQGRRLLANAAVTCGYLRAALVLSLHYMHYNMMHEARQFLNYAKEKNGNTRIELLRAYLEACEGKSGLAATRLDKLAAKADGRVHYTLGNLYLQCADESRRAGDQKRSRLFSLQAAGAFRTAIKEGFTGHLPPIDCQALEHVAEFLAFPDKEQKSNAMIWREIQALPPTRKPEWLVWDSYLATLWFGSVSDVAVAGQVALPLLSSSNVLNEATREVLASALAHACTIASETDVADKLSSQLSFICGKSVQSATKAYGRIGLSAAARIAYPKTLDQFSEQTIQRFESLNQADPGNVYLALILAQIHIINKNIIEAALVLQNVTPEDEFEKRLCSCLSAVLGGQAVLVKDFPRPAFDASPNVVQACHLLCAAAAFASGLSDQGYSEVYEAMKVQTGDMRAIFDFYRFLPAICMQSMKGLSAPPQLMHAIHAQSNVQDIQVVSLARCAAAIGDVEYACQLWDNAVKNVPDDALCAEYAGFLCYLAVIASKSGQTLEAAKRLDLAANKVVGAVPGLEPLVLRTHAQDIKLQIATSRLVKLLFSKKDEGKDLSGRYHFLVKEIERSRGLLDALLNGNDVAAFEKWHKVLLDHKSDPVFYHGLTVLFHDNALGSFNEDVFNENLLLLSTSLWLRLLCSKGFWNYFSEERFANRDESTRQPLKINQQEALFKEVLQNILLFHNKNLRQFFVAGENDRAKIHLRCIDLCRRISDASAMIQKSLNVPFALDQDNQKVEQAKLMAEKILDEWGSSLIRDSEKVADDVESIKMLPKGIRRNYAGGIKALEKVIAFDVPIVRVLTASLQLYNSWCYDRYVTKDFDAINEVMVNAHHVADKLAPCCVPHQGFNPQNKELSQHFVLQGFTERDPKVAQENFETALYWNPGNPDAIALLDNLVEEIYKQQIEKAIEFVKEKQFEEAYGIINSVEPNIKDKNLIRIARAVTNFQHAQMLANEGKLRSAYDHAREAQKLEPTQAAIAAFVREIEPLVPEEANLRYLHEANEEFDKAHYSNVIDAASKVSSKSSLHARACSLQSAAYFYIGIQAAKDSHFTKAEQSLEESLKLNSNPEERKMIAAQLEVIQKNKLGENFKNAMEKRDWPKAERILRQAIEDERDKKFIRALESQLSNVLNAQAVDLSNSAQVQLNNLMQRRTNGEYMSNYDVLNKLVEINELGSRSIALLQEAVSLDKSNQVAKKNLEVIKNDNQALSKVINKMG